jgi:hypothetical protein
MRGAALLALAASGCSMLLGLDDTRFEPGDAAALDVGAADACALPGCQTSFASCRALRDDYPSAPSGVYPIAAGAGTFDAFCEQTADGGGWTLALKIDGMQDTFAYDQPIWENDTLLGTSSPGIEPVEAKLQTWSALAFTELRLGLEAPPGSGDVRWLVIPLAASRLGELFAPGQTRVTTVGRTAWKSLMAGSSLQLNCNLEGTNVYHEYSRVRLGILGNNEDNCATPDSRIGIGGGGTVCGEPTQSAGNTACYSPDNGNVELPAFAWLFVR